jgi:hypothetical protein
VFEFLVDVIFIGIKHMFKKLSLFLAAILIAGCASLGVPSPETFNQRIAATVVTVTAVREQTLVLGQAGKLSKEDAANIQAQADTVVAGAAVARSLALTDPNAANAKLANTRAVLVALQAYLLAKESK